jgi:Inward rectifier potassium channel C-terminal domain
MVALPLQFASAASIPAPFCSQVTELEAVNDTGSERLVLWLPICVKHKITESSPIAAWRTKAGFLGDADSLVVVEVCAHN